MREAFVFSQLHPTLQRLYNYAMSLEEAIALIAQANFPKDTPQQWADLGCGAGLFSQALASRLPAGSRIFCVDKERQRIRQPVEYDVILDFLQRDFSREPLLWTDLEGILMANSLHYVRQGTFYQTTSITSGRKRPIHLR